LAGLKGYSKGLVDEVSLTSFQQFARKRRSRIQINPENLRIIALKQAHVGEKLKRKDYGFSINFEHIVARRSEATHPKFGEGFLAKQ
ncbi:hypothetical protein X801_06985, partial [Opisthorchis viverrini]